MATRRLGLLLLLLSLAFCGSVSAQTPGVWQELLNTSVTPHIPSGCGGNDIPAAVITAWVDGDYHPPSKSFIIPRGGGHADNCFNGAVAFSTETLTWRRTTERGQFIVMTSAAPATSFVNPYNNEPQAVHSYGGVAMMHGLGKIWTAGGIFWSPPGYSDNKTWWYDPTKTTVPLAYQQKANRPGGYGTFAVGDPSDGSVLLRISSGFWRYTPANDTYAKLFDQSGVSTGSSSLALDVDGRKVYRIQGHTTAPWHVKMIDLNNLAAKEVQLLTEGDTEVETTTAGGLFFDAGKLRAFGVGPVAGSGAMYSLDPTACGLPTQPLCRWIRHVPPSGPHPPRGTVNGIWKKWFNGRDGYYYGILGGGNVWRIAVGAAPPVPTYALTISPIGDGGGTVTGQGTYPLNTAVTMIPTPNATSTFTGFGGDPDCTDGTVTMTSPKLCTAQFTKIQVTLALSSIGSTGAGTLTGAGTYPIGQVVLVGAAPDPGSITGAVTGDPGCQIGSMTMISNKACNIPFLDSQNPVLMVTSPTENQLIKVVTPLTYTVTDNQPNPTAMVLLDGQPFTAQDLDPSSLPEGLHQLIFRAVDAAGNSTQITRNVFSVQCPVCPLPPITSYPLTVVMAGTGTGTVSGGGSYAAATMVSIGGAPATGSVDGGLAPPPCSRTAFPMPAAPLTCTQTYTLAATGVFPANQWVLWPTPPVGSPLSIRAGKHQRMFYSERHGGFLVGGGDRFGSDAGQPAVEVVNSSTGASTVLSPMCPPAPALMPHFPDNVIWTVDAKRNRVILERGFFFHSINRSKAACGRDAAQFLADGVTPNPAFDPNVAATGLIFDFATNKWLPPAWPVAPMGPGSDGSGPTQGIIDPVTDTLWSIKKDGAWGSNLQRLDLATNVWTKFQMGAGLLPDPTVSQWTKTSVKSANAYRSRPVIADGILYVVSARGPPVDPATYVSGNAGSSLVIVPLNAPTKGSAVPLPAAPPSGTSAFGDDVEACIVHDPKANVILMPYNLDLTGKITSLYVYDIPAKTWEMRPVPAMVEAPAGGACAWDPVHEALAIHGRKIGNLPGYFMWRYRYQKGP